MKLRGTRGSGVLAAKRAYSQRDTEGTEKTKTAFSVSLCLFVHGLFAAGTPLPPGTPYRECPRGNTIVTRHYHNNQFVK